MENEPGTPTPRTKSGLGRLFAHGDLRLVILNLISEKPRHGYELIREIEDAVGGSYSPSPGTIYPMLTLLEELGYVTVTPSAEGAKRQHEITVQGRLFLEANRPALQVLLTRMAAASEQRQFREPPEIEQAIEGIRSAVAGKACKSSLAASDVQSIVTILTAAAAKISS